MKKGSYIKRNSLTIFVIQAGFEPTTYGLEGNSLVFVMYLLSKYYKTHKRKLVHI